MLQMVKERQDQIGLNVSQRQAGRRLVQLVCGKVQEQNQCIAITGHRAWADRTLRDQILGEELLNQRGKRWRLRCGDITHRTPPTEA